MIGVRIYILAGLLLSAWLPAAAVASSETLGYHVYYQGLLSAMRQVAIADARLVTEPADNGRIQVTTLTLSSAAHGMVDALYPIRYRLRSVYDLREPRLVVMERFKRTRKIKHDLAWVDAADGRLHYLRAAGAGPATTLPTTLRRWVGDAAFHSAASEPVSVAAGLLDRLALLQTLRRDIPPSGRTMTLPVTDGPALFRYQVRLEGAETISLAGRDWPAWKLRVEGHEQAADGSVAAEPEHAPVYLWISRDSRRLPLRFQIDHSVGTFTVERTGDDLPVTVAMDAPLPAGDTWDDEG